MDNNRHVCHQASLGYFTVSHIKLQKLTS